MYYHLSELIQLQSKIQFSTYQYKTTLNVHYMTIKVKLHLKIKCSIEITHRLFNIMSWLICLEYFNFWH